MNCNICKDVGFLLVEVSDVEGGIHAAIERCDNCEMFCCDDEAVAACFDMAVRAHNTREDFMCATCSRCMSLSHLTSGQPSEFGACGAVHDLTDPLRIVNKVSLKPAPDWCPLRGSAPR